MRLSQIVLLLGGLIWMAPTAAAGQEAVGSITQLVGGATVTRKQHQESAKLTMIVELKDRLATSPNGELTVTMYDQSELRMSSSTSVVIDNPMGVGFGPSPSISLLVGHVRTIVQQILRTSAPAFTVGTPNSAILVRGTDFDTAYIVGKPCPGFPTCLRYTDVGVKRGLVEVRNRLNNNAPPVVLEAGYETSVPCEYAPAPASPLGINDLIGPAYR